MKTKVLIADDHEMILEGLCLLLENENIEIIGTAQSGQQVLDLVETLTEIDIILLDINMPGLDGIEVTKIIKQKYPEIKILILTMYKQVEFVKNLMKVGTDGYVLKNSGKRVLLEALDTLLKGGRYFSSEILDSIVDSYTEKRASKDMKVIPLSKREKEVVQLIVEGMSSAQIAARLFISLHAVNSHRKSILNKLDVKNVAGIFRYALQTGIVKGFDL